MGINILDWFDHLKAKHWFILCIIAILMGQAVQWYDSVTIGSADMIDPTSVERYGEPDIHTIKLGEKKTIYFSRLVCSDGKTLASVPRVIKSIETEGVIDSLVTVQYTPQRGCHVGKYTVLIDTSKRNALGSLIYKPGFYRYCPEAFYQVKYDTLSHGTVEVGTVRKFLPVELFEVIE